MGRHAIISLLEQVVMKTNMGGFDHIRFCPLDVPLGISKKKARS
jgi:hypothetical protein